MVSSSKGSTVAVVGSGLIGLTIARSLSDEGLEVTLIGAPSPGEASPASAGMLAPSVERSVGPAHEFALASRDRFPQFLDELYEETGLRVPLNRRGILQVALTAAGVKGLRKSVLPAAEWIDERQLHLLEPALAHGLGAVFTPDDGCVDNVALLDALNKVVARKSVRLLRQKVLSVESSGGTVELCLDNKSQFRCDTVIIAAGAWCSTIGGVRYGKFVRPLKGQMISYNSTPLRHVVYGPRGYIVPRERGHTLAGSTMEDSGFNVETSAEGITRVRSAAEEICPVLSLDQPAKTWAGLRPVTPDLLPLLGADPSDPRIVYACGHSRNGVLLAPLTGEIVADLVVGRRVGFDLMQFRPDRFQY